MIPIRKLQRVALYMFFFSLSFENWDPFDPNGDFSVSKLAGFIYLLTILPQLSIFLKTNNLKSVIRPLWLFWILLTTMGIVNISYNYLNFFNFSIFQNIFILWFLINHEREDPGILEKGLFYFSLGSIVLALLYNFGIGIEYDQGRLRMLGDNSNTIGIKMSIAIAMFIFTIFQNNLKKNKLRFLLLLPIPLMLQFLIETSSRTAFIALILMLFVGGLLIRSKKVWKKILIVMVFVFGLFFIWQMVIQSDILMMRLLASSEQGDLAHRDVIWEHVIPLIERNPVFGVGETGYDYYSQRTFGRALSPHNVFLEILCYTGIIGMSLYLIFLGQVIKRSFWEYKVNYNLLPLLLLIPIFGLLLSGQILTNKIGWLIYAYNCSGLITVNVHNKMRYAQDVPMLN